MPPQSSISSSAPPPPSACHHNTCHGKKCSPWHLDILPNDQLFTKVDPDHADLIIVVMGLTGAGKSTFINQYLGEEVVKVGHRLKSCTEKVESTTRMLPENHKTWPNRRLVLVDTPGFDDTKQGELQILQNIATWLASTYDNNTKINGLIYLYNIANPRLGGTALLSHDVFHQICGPNALSRVVMATTHWGKDPEAHQIYQDRVQELKTDFWAELLESDAIHMPVQTPPNDIEDIIEYILSKQSPVAAQVQQELVDLKKRVRQTKAGRKITDFLEKRCGVAATTGPPITTGDPLKTTPSANNKLEITPEDPPIAANALKATPSPNNANYKLDIHLGDRLFTDACPDDLIIVVMGMVGAGKSTFINRFCDNELMPVNHGLRSCTREIDVAVFKLPSTHPVCPNRRLVLVDTPGFDDTDYGEYEVLRRISVWLASIYDVQVKVAGFVYLHNISNPRVCGLSALSYEIFHRICGPAGLKATVLASTQWETIMHQPSAGRIREGDLKEFWSTTLEHGAVYRRIDVADPKRDIQDIIDYILENAIVEAQIQHELVELNKRVAETEAALKLKEILESWLGDPNTQDLSQEKEEQLKEFTVESGFVDWVKGLFRLKRHPDLTGSVTAKSQKP